MYFLLNLPEDNMSDKNKNVILKKLLEVYNEKNVAGNTNSELGKSINFAQLKSELKMDELKLQSNLDSLHFEKYVDRTPLGTAYSDSTRFSITLKGKNALLGKEFAWDSSDKILKYAPIIISIIALLVSIFK